MATVEIRVDVVGRPHTFLYIVGPDGIERGYGLAPRQSGSLAGDGWIYDDTRHEYSATTGPISLSDTEYARLADYVNRSIANPPPYYLPFGSQCANWAVAALQEIGIAGIYPNLFPDSFLRDMFETVAWNPYTQWMNIKINEAWTYATGSISRDPLALDLDGDGIDTLGIPTIGSPILFDHDADGVRTATGWVKGDDGWLVRDLNGNGIIDSGRELFGVDTRIVSRDYVGGGSWITQERNAYGGFDALRVLDTGSGPSNAGLGDALIDSRDAAFGELKIWRDLNQDGVSQTGELQSLSAAGIASISLQSTLTNTDLGNGNTVSATATVTRSAGMQTQVGSVGLTNAGNLNLGDNPFYRTFSDTIPLTQTAKALPEMGGSGWVRDLREAMSLSTGGPLSTAVQQFSAATTRSAQLALVDSILGSWAAGTGRLAPTSAQDKVYSWVVNDTGASKTYRYVATDVVPGTLWNANYTFARPDFMITQTNGVGVTSVQFTAAAMAWFERRNVLEVFNGQRFLSFEQTVSNSSSAGGGSSSGGGGGGGTVGGGTPSFTVGITNAQVDLIDQAYLALRESVYGALALQTRLARYLDAVELTIDANGLRFNSAPMHQLLQSSHGGAAQVGMEDLAELLRFAMPTLQAVGYDGMATLRQWVEAQPAGSAVLQDLVAAGLLSYGAGAATSSAGDVYLGGAANDIADGGLGDDAIDGGLGNDLLLGGDGNDALFGRSGTDTLYGDSGNDVIDGGTGTDTLYGGIGNNIYLFGRGDGQDVIEVAFDDAAAKLNTIEFKSGVLPSEIVARRIVYNGWNSLELSIAGTTDKLIARGFFNSDDPANAYNPVQQVRFADGTVWNITAIVAKVFAGTADTDTISGTTAGDVITGQAGADTISGRAGDDTLDGGASDDILYGEEGNDALDGGTGVDTLYGGLGNNTYRFGRGDGQDTINGTYDTASGKLNTLEFKSGIAPSDIVARRVYDGNTFNDLEISVAGTTDTIKLRYFFVGDDPNTPYNPVQQIRFADNTVWNGADILTRLFQGTSGNDLAVGTISSDIISGQGGADTISGRDGNDTLNGGADNDTLYGEAGDDILDGGAGADSMTGGTGNDKFVVDNAGDTTLESAGSGWDYVVSSLNWTLASNIEGLHLSGSASIGTGNELNNYLQGTGGVNTLYGLAGNDMLNGGSGNDVMIGGMGDDTYLVNDLADTVTELAGEGQDTVQLYSNDPAVYYFTLPANVENLDASGDSLNHYLGGNALNNTLTGGVGNDSLNGQSGTDTMIGGAGNDTYFVHDTTDVIVEQAGGGVDTVLLYPDAWAFQSFTLPQNVENADASGHWNRMSLTGNAADNLLFGGSQPDTFDGLGGNDRLRGGQSGDTYKFGIGYGIDTIEENDATPGAIDKVMLGAGITSSDLVFARVNNSLEVSLLGRLDKLIVQDWYLGSQYRIEEMYLNDGSAVSLTQAANLVAAMASFSQPSATISSPTMTAQYWRGPDLAVAVI